MLKVRYLGSWRKPPPSLDQAATHYNGHKASAPRMNLLSSVRAECPSRDKVASVVVVVMVMVGVDPPRVADGTGQIGGASSTGQLPFSDACVCGKAGRNLVS